jgi:1A family penicillin-binding protein
VIELLKQYWNKTPFGKLSWNQFLLFLTFTLCSTTLIFFYLPLPSSIIPLASEVYDCDQHLAATFYLQNRVPVSLEEVPLFLRQAFLAVEDHRFYHHRGINLGRIGKALINNLIHQQIEQGASTITQQLVKNAYLDQNRTLIRKLKELFYTIKVELQLSKDQILENYLNQIYFGHGAYGIKIAATTYFGKELGELNQVEMALLAGLPKGPAYYSPYNHKDSAYKRLKQVLRRMVDCSYLTEAEFREYSQQKLHLPGLRSREQKAPYFLDLLQAELGRIFPKAQGIIYTGGLKIESTLDLKLQNLAEKSLAKGLPKLILDSNGLVQPQGALIAIDPRNGQIAALVGGTDYSKSKFNRAIQAKRQPGSSFKPILYAAALSEKYTLASMFDTTPQSYDLGTEVYQPLDSQTTAERGLLSLREALACSSNVIAVKLLNQLGFDPVLNMAKRLGINSPLPQQLSLALGSGETSPLELTKAYIPLANGGLLIEPTTIRRIFDHKGRLLYQASSSQTQVLNPGIAYLVTQALTGVFEERGTAANIRGLIDRPVAGKTGTTEDNRDAWFIGYTPDLLVTVFVGCDRNERPLPGSGSRIAAPIWADFLRKALADKPKLDFVIPNEIVKVLICKETGAKATAFCEQNLEYFLTGTEPKEYCSRHRFIKLEVCKKTGLLPGPYCLTEEKTFLLSEQPIEICDLCHEKRFLKWLRKLFRKR